MAIFRGAGGSGDATTDATNQASVASDAAAAALASQTAAANSAANASTSATNAANSATSATNSATSATASQTAAAVSESNAATTYDNFDDRYLGQKATEPSVDNDGDTLLTGALYFNSTSSTMFVWTGSAWATISNTATSISAAASAAAAATSESNAATSATNSANSASTASTQAGSATTSATNAATSASNASTSASNAATSASNAATSASNAATSATSAANSLDSFDDRYLGSKATAPSVDNDGNTLLTGALYWNSTSNVMNVWTGSAWVLISSGSAGSGTVTSITAGTGLSGGTITTSGTIAIDSTVATLTGSQTLTNKSISGSTNTLSNIGNSSLTNSAITINGTSTSLGGSISVGTVTGVTGTAPIVSSGGAAPAISITAATTSVAGSMSSADKTKLDGIATSANNYSLPIATSTVLGGVELFSDTVQTVAANAVSTTASRTYGVQLNSAGQAVINVPWTDANSGGTVTSVTGTAPVAVATGTTTPVISLNSGYGDTQNPYASKTANFVLAAPNGSAGVPTFRAIVSADIPTLNQNTTGTASNVTGTVALANGGTNATTAAGARTSLLPSYTGNGGKVLAVNAGATDVEYITVGGTGTVTSVAATVPTGFSISGSPITSAGTLGITYTAGYSLPTTSSQTNWDTAFTDRLKWDGGATGLTAATGRTSLGATTVGSNLFTLTNPTAITFPRFNADNTVSALDAATFRTAIGAGTSSTTGTVTSVAALTLGTTGTDLSSSVATSTTTPVITLNVPTASATNRGALSSTDWTTFNNKGSGTVTSVSWTGGIVSVATATTTPAFTVAGTSGGIPYFSSGTTWASSAALAANALVIGGGAGAAPATTTTGTGVVTALGVDANGTGGFITDTGSVTLTNKTISADNNTLSGIAASSFVLSNGSGNIDGAAAQKAIPSGVVVGTTDTQTLSAKTLTGTKETVFTITDGTAFEIDPANGGIQTITLGASRTPKGTNFTTGQSVTLMVNDGTAYTLTWTDTTFGTGGVVWVGGTAPTLATTGFTVIELWEVGTQVYGALVGTVA